MTGVLLVLALFSIIAGFLGLFWDMTSTNLWSPCITLDRQG
jgi:hypothetical protein